MKPSLLLLLAFAVTFAQTPQRSVTLTWQDTANPSGTSYTVYPATGLCRGTPTFSKLATAVSARRTSTPPCSRELLLPGDRYRQQRGISTVQFFAGTGPQFSPRQLVVSVQ